jgi:GNAT superfamily N-acetyltransferase
MRRARRTSAPRRLSGAASPRRARLRVCILDAGEIDALLIHRRAMMSEISSVPPEEMDRYIPRFRRWLIPRLKSEEVVAIAVRTSSGEVVGSGCVWMAPDHPRPERSVDFVPYLFSMYTTPEFRGRGIATRIVRAAERVAASRGSDRMRLHAAPEARRLYRELGFKRGWEMRKLLTRSRRGPSSPRRPGRKRLR